MDDTSPTLPPLDRLTRDLANASVTLSDDEARFLVDAYYMMQENRKRSSNQVRALAELQEPHTVIRWLTTQSEMLEGQIKRALDKYTDSRPVGQWMKSIHGIGPVIAAGLMAHIDIRKAPMSGHIWNFAGLNPTVKWEKGQKRPWNAALKTLCWKVGQSFMKFSGSDECFYGKLYRDRKAYEVQRNDSGGNAAEAARILATKRLGKSTEAFKHLSAGHLPPAQIDARARRYAVKMFLSHLQAVWWEIETGEEPPKPYAIEKAGHAHYIPPPNWP